MSESHLAPNLRLRIRSLSTSAGYNAWRFAVGAGAADGRPKQRGQDRLVGCCLPLRVARAVRPPAPSAGKPRRIYRFHSRSQRKAFEPVWPRLCYAQRFVPNAPILTGPGTATPAAPGGRHRTSRPSFRPVPAPNPQPRHPAPDAPRPPAACRRTAPPRADRPSPPTSAQARSGAGSSRCPATAPDDR